jgi:hypothetical protein
VETDSVVAGWLQRRVEPLYIHRRVTLCLLLRETLMLGVAALRPRVVVN